MGQSVAKEGVRGSPISWSSFLICLGFGFVIWCIPVPEGVNPRAWSVLAVFVAALVGVITRPFPMGVVALLALSVLTGTATLSFSEAFESYSSPVVWLVLIAFFIAKGFVVTGLGNRIAYWFIYALGRRTLGLAYGLVATDLMIAPAVPSLTARSAGILFPIIQGLASCFQSYPHDESRRRVGQYLILVSFQGTVITSAMFMTAMVANPLVAELASGLLGVEISWSDWAIAGLVPGLCSLALLPLLIYLLSPPELKSTPNSVEFAKEKMREIGPMKRTEKLLVGILSVLLVLWIFGRSFGVSTTEGALFGLSALLLTGILSWDEVMSEKGAWETFLWFGALVMMAGQLNTLGLTQWIGSQVIQLFEGQAWTVALPALLVIYSLCHYFFAGVVAHISSLYGPFVAVAVGLGAPPMLGALAFAYFSNLSGGITHYSCTPAPILFGGGYVPVKKWWTVGALVLLCNCVIWLIVGRLWWGYLGLWT